MVLLSGWTDWWSIGKRIPVYVRVQRLLVNGSCALHLIEASQDPTAGLRSPGGLSSSLNLLLFFRLEAEERGTDQELNVPHSTLMQNTSCAQKKMCLCSKGSSGSTHHNYCCCCWRNFFFYLFRPFTGLKTEILIISMLMLSRNC